MDRPIVLITGGSGFLGQHLVKELQNDNNDIGEIRILDREPFHNKLGFVENIPLKFYSGDIVTMEENYYEAFHNVTTVFHCASYVSYEFPSDYQKLQDINIEGTKNVINQCLLHNVPYLIYTSTAEVCMKPYFRNGFFSVIINQSEAKITPPNDCGQLIFGSYAESKLLAEQLVLNADNYSHFSGDGKLRTIALRPTFMYGEEDQHMIPTIMNISNSFNNKLLRIGGAGGRHQVVYVGNVAWAHCCAQRALQENPDSIGGVPFFITDDSSITDLLCFCKKLCSPLEKNEETSAKSLSTTSWYIPVAFSFIFFMIFEYIYRNLSKIIELPKLPVSPKSFVIYLGSVIFFSRLRAIINLDYSPKYEPSAAYERSKMHYTRLFCKISDVRLQKN